MKCFVCVLAALIASCALALAQKPTIAANGVQDSASNTVNVAQGGSSSSKVPISAIRV